jgi:hypothetical protein
MLILFGKQPTPLGLYWIMQHSNSCAAKQWIAAVLATPSCTIVHQSDLMMQTFLFIFSNFRAYFNPIFMQRFV